MFEEAASRRREKEVKTARKGRELWSEDANPFWERAEQTLPYQ